MLQHSTKDWLRAVARHMNLSLSDLALKSGLAASTVTRYVNDGSGKIGITQRTLEAIVAYSGVPLHALPGERRLPGFGEPDAVYYTPDQNLDMPEWVRDAVAAARANRNGVEAWVMKGRALDMLGILPGDVLIIDQNARPRAGDVVCAQVTDLFTGATEIVMRRFDPPYLLTYSAKVGPAKPEVVDEERVVIMGVQTGLIRPRH